jgi:hypothetical protein
MNKVLITALGLLWGHPEVIAIVVIVYVVIRTIVSNTNVDFALFLGFHNRD